MSRLDELYAMREKIDGEIRAELDALKSVGELRDEITTLLATARTVTARILVAVSEVYGIPIEEITGRSRGRHTVEARHVACWLLHRARTTYVEIGRVFGRDHSTAMHAVTRVNNTARLRVCALQIEAALRPDVKAVS